MTLAWHLRGYERETEMLAKDVRLPPNVIRAISAVLTDGTDEAISVEPSELTPRTAARIADAIGMTIEADRFDYFVEAEEDWRIVAAMREPPSLGA